MTTLNNIKTKDVCVKAITTRLKPNHFGNHHPYWGELKKAMNKMTIDELNSFEALISGHKLKKSNGTYI